MWSDFSLHVERSQNLSPPRILNKCTFSTRGFTNKLIFAPLVRFNLWASESDHKTLFFFIFFVRTPGEPSDVEVVNMVFLNPQQYMCLSLDSGALEWTEVNKLNQSKVRRRAFKMNPAKRTNLWHISNTTSALPQIPYISFIILQCCRFFKGSALAHLTLPSLALKVNCSRKKTCFLPVYCTAGLNRQNNRVNLDKQITPPESQSLSRV